MYTYCCTGKLPNFKRNATNVIVSLMLRLVNFHSVVQPRLSKMDLEHISDKWYQINPPLSKNATPLGHLFKNIRNTLFVPYLLASDVTIKF